MKNYLRRISLLTFIFVGSLLWGYFILPNFVIAEESVPIITGYTSEPFLGNYYAIDGFDFGGSEGGVIVSGKDKGLTIKSWSDTKIEIAFTDRSTFDLGIVNNFFIRTSDGQESPTGNILIRAHSADASSVENVDNLSLRIGSQADILGNGFGNNGLAEGGEVVVTGTSNKQSIVSWESSKIRIVIGDVPTRQPITFTVRTSQGGEFVDSTPTEAKVILSNKPLIGLSRFTNAYKYYLDQDEYFFITGNAFGSLRGTLFNVDLNKELHISEWSDGEIRIFPKQNSENLRMGANRFILRTADGFESDPFTITFEIKIRPECKSWTYSSWSVCSSAGLQTRSVLDSTPIGCASGNPILQQICTPFCSLDTWMCGAWEECSGAGTQRRSCVKTFDCPTASTPSPTTLRACTPVQPECDADVWTCNAWDGCSVDGVQRRTCTKSFDCPSIETAIPDTARYCTPPNIEKYQVSPADQQVTNQETIVKSTVNLWCPLGGGWYQTGSGTVIDALGTILTNKHVIQNTPGCLVGFINSYKDEPFFGERQIAEVTKVAVGVDMAVLKLRNPNKKQLSYIDISGGNSSSLNLGEKISTYGYPTKFGSKLTSTKGDFSGVDGHYLKTTAILEKGNSGGGAYLQNGTFIGIPTKVFIGDLNNLGGILAIDTINNWLAGRTLAQNYDSGNQFSRVSSILESVDTNKLDSFKLYVGDDFSKEPEVTKKSSKIQNDKIEQVQPTQPQEESTVIEPTDEESEITVATESESYKLPWWKRFFLWLANLFGRLAGAS